MTKDLGVCRNYKADHYCGQPAVSLYMFGPRCLDCRPIVPVPDPRSSLTGLLAAKAARLEELRPTRYYDGSPGRETAPCPNCGFPAVASIGDHGIGVDDRGRFDPKWCRPGRFDGRGNVRTDLDEGLFELACLAIRRAAVAKPTFSSNDTRQVMDQDHIPISVRARAFKTLTGIVMQPLDYAESTEKLPRSRATPKPVRTYTSLIYVETRELVGQP